MAMVKEVACHLQVYVCVCVCLRRVVVESVLRPDIRKNESGVGTHPGATKERNLGYQASLSFSFFLSYCCRASKMPSVKG